MSQHAANHILVHGQPRTTKSLVQSLSHVWLFATPWRAARQASLSITNSQSLLKLMPIESVMPSSHLILCHPLLLLPPSPSQLQGLFQWVNSSPEVAKVLEFQLQHQSFQWTPRTDLLQDGYPAPNINSSEVGYSSCRMPHSWDFPPSEMISNAYTHHS